MSNQIWVYIDQFGGEALPVSWEVLAAGQQLAAGSGGTVVAVALGEGLDGLAQEAFRYGASEVLLADSAVLAEYRPEAYANVFSKLAADAAPDVILFPTTGRGRELGALTAVDLETGILPDAVALELQDGEVVATRPVYGGKALSKVRCNVRPQIITVRGRVFERTEVEAPAAGNVSKGDVSVAEGDLTTKVVENIASSGGVSLSDASIIVSGGRGVSSSASLEAPGDLDSDAAELWRAEQGFKLIRELAEVLNAAVGASRAAVDAGYISYEYQVGQTGKIVSPDLYIACGVSGAIQHLAGMRNSKLIVAIEEEADAPIFRYSNYGVQGDLHAIVPALSEALRSRLNS
jgi:electron transfer flavoprotein alpha subunit